ncbi:MAG: hypothetical protein V4717_01735 [Bacteroidota bacterium]
MQKIFALRSTTITGIALLISGHMMRESFTGIPGHYITGGILTVFSLVILTLSAFYSKRVPAITLVIMLLFAIVFLLIPSIFSF